MAIDDRALEPPDPEADTVSADDIPDITEDERAELLQSLVDAEARIDAGEFYVLDSATFKARFEEIGRTVRRARGT